MKKFLFSVLMLSFLGIALQAKPNSTTKHTVKKGETLYSISKNYGIKVDDLTKANPRIGTLKAGQQIVIPHQATGTQASNARPKTVAVPSTPETPYREEDSRKRTTAAEAAIAIGNEQPITTKGTSGARETNTADAQPVPANITDYAAIFNHYATHGYKEKKNRGAANYLAENTSGSPYLALYNGAEMGSVIKVTNMMNNKMVYVKVVGKVPPVDAGKEVIIKLSKKAATDLDAVDEKFLVEVVGFAGK